MSVAEWVQLSKNDEKQAIRYVFDTYYPCLSAIATRLAKDTAQAEEMLCYSFYACVSKLKHQLKSLHLDDIFKAEFIRGCVSYAKGFGKAYFVSSTVDVCREKPNYILSSSTKHLTDFSKLHPTVFLEALRALVPAQRMVFSLVIAEGYSIEQSAELLECSIEAAKFNLEKAKLNFNKHLLVLSAVSQA
ncbi:MAG: hypothetical protein MUF75_07655 [Bacteroidia bacterium]|jgi:hypothetical protein|nr:hypothetical protein [Bacteroidia bacterium]